MHQTTRLGHDKKCAAMHFHQSRMPAMIPGGAAAGHAGASISLKPARRPTRAAAAAKSELRPIAQPRSQAETLIFSRSSPVLQRKASQKIKPWGQIRLGFLACVRRLLQLSILVCSSNVWQWLRSPGRRPPAAGKKKRYRAVSDRLLHMN